MILICGIISVIIAVIVVNTFDVANKDMVILVICVLGIFLGTYLKNKKNENINKTQK
ncbi:MAG: hypothetical protein Q4B36_05400 [Tissierellia bacterium]|nr:hypothetical protein [Tissierellia bacterium]